MQPEAEIAALVAPQIDEPRERDHQEPERHRDDTPRRPGFRPGHVAPVGDPGREIHRHEPQRERHHGDDERERIEAQGHETRRDGGDLHRQPAAFHPDVEALITPGTPGSVPPAERILKTEDRERDHGDRHRDHQPAGGREGTPMPKIMTAGGEQGRIDQGCHGERRSAHLLERERREQAHGPHDDERARIPEKVHEVEAHALVGARGDGRRGGRRILRPHHDEQALDLFVAKGDGTAGAAQIGIGEGHGAIHASGPSCRRRSARLRPDCGSGPPCRRSPPRPSSRLSATTRAASLKIVRPTAKPLTSGLAGRGREGRLAVRPPALRAPAARCRGNRGRSCGSRRRWRATPLRRVCGSSFHQSGLMPRS